MIPFPDCDVFTMPQRSEAWHAIRADKLTGSAMGAWLAERPECRMTVAEISESLAGLGIAFKKSAKRDDLLDLLPETHRFLSMTKGAIEAREKAICKVLGAMSKCEVPDEFEIDPDGLPPRNPGLWAIWNGIRLEPEARACFERATGHKVEEVGFCRHKSKASGCSPDGLIPSLGEGLEMKCPLPATHVGYLRAGVLPDSYRDQVHGCMAVTGATAWWFQSYCPGLPPFRVRVERDEYTERMAEGLNDFARSLDQARAAMAQLWKRKDAA